MYTTSNLHREIYRARDQHFYTRAELSSGEFIYAGPFLTPTEAMVDLQAKYRPGEHFVFDDSGRRPVPAGNQLTQVTA